MIPNNSDYINGFNKRNQLKGFKGYLFSFLREGTNCSPIESEVIADEVRNRINLFIPDAILPGKLIFTAVRAEEPAGKPIKQCKKTHIYLTLIDPKTEDNRLGVETIRRIRLIRIIDEAFIQGTLLTQEDCATILGIAVRTVRRIVKSIREEEITLPLRGFIRDIGRTISHKVQIIKKYIDGTEIVDLINATKHSLDSIERYLTTFGRIVFLYQRGMKTDEIRFIAKTSLSLTQEYIKIYESLVDNDFKQNRVLELTGERFKKKHQRIGGCTLESES